MSSQEDSEDSNLVIIPVEDSLSDGSLDTWPKNDEGRFTYVRIDDSKWRATLASLWVGKTGAQEKDIHYVLEKLPDGFALFDRARGTDPRFRDKFLFGHPSGFYFQSAQTFFPHFFWLMSERVQPCECKNCVRAGEGRVPHFRRTKAEMEAAKGAPRSKAKRALGRPKALPAYDPSWPVTEDGPDYWKIHIMKLKAEGTIDEKIDHPLNMDWVLTHEWLETYFTLLTLQPSFVPRRGELVLWCHELDGSNSLQVNPATNTYQVRAEDGTWLGQPNWRAGVVTQTPEEVTSFLDIVMHTTKKNNSVSYFGFRVETLPDPIGTDKSLSLHYKYIPLKAIKPFNAFHLFLDTVPREALHPSIEHAVTVMASWSICSNIRFEGTWPNGRIHSRGIFIGTDLVALKDAVRLKPFGLKWEHVENGDPNTYYPIDVMVVEDIVLQLEGCVDDPQDEQLAKQITPLLMGKVYTLDKNRLDHPIPFSKDPLQKLSYNETVAAFHQVGMHGYGDWYRVAGGKKCIVSQVMVLGRCYEPQATEFYFGEKRLRYDLHTVLKGRNYSSQVDHRIPDGIEWFWGDSRVEALGLESVNGVECGVAADQRQTPERWQAILKILIGRYTDADVEKAKLPRRVGRPSKIFQEVSKTSSLVSSGLGGISDPEEGGNGDDSEMDLSESELKAPIPFRGKEESDSS